MFVFPFSSSLFRPLTLYNPTDTVLVVSLNESTKSATRISSLYSFTSVIVGVALGVIVRFVHRLKPFMVAGVLVFILAFVSHRESLLGFCWTLTSSLDYRGYSSATVVERRTMLVSSVVKSCSVSRESMRTAERDDRRTLTNSPSLPQGRSFPLPWSSSDPICYQTSA